MHIWCLSRLAVCFASTCYRIIYLNNTYYTHVHFWFRNIITIISIYLVCKFPPVMVETARLQHQSCPAGRSWELEGLWKSHGRACVRAQSRCTSPYAAKATCMPARTQVTLDEVHPRQCNQWSKQDTRKVLTWCINLGYGINHQTERKLRGTTFQRAVMDSVRRSKDHV